MAYYFRCPICRAYLDPGEICDCAKREAAPDTANIRSGKNESEVTSCTFNSILHERKEVCQG